MISKRLLINSFIFALVWIAAFIGMGAELGAKTGRAPSRSASRNPAAKTEPLLPSDEVDSPLASADAGVGDMYVSHDYKGSFPKAHPGEDILSFEAQLIRDFKDGTGFFKQWHDVPDKNKGIVLRRYEEGDKDVTEGMIVLSHEGFRKALIIFDFNPAMDGKFADRSEKHNSNFDAATPKSYPGPDGKPKLAPMAEMIKRLRTEGKYELNNLDHGIVSQPLYQGDMTPIMHNKDMIFIIYDDAGKVKELVLFTGSNNMTRNPRYNRMFRITDQVAAQYILDNCLEMAATFARGGEIKDIKSKPPLRIKYKDGSYLELAFTDGKYNPNDRIQETLEAAAANPGKIKMKSATFSEFVFTDGGVMEALRKAMTAHSDMTTFAVLDDKFLATHEYGRGAALAGYNTMPEFGKGTFGFSSALRSRITAFGYQKQAEGRVETDPSGPPLSREVWHDKTTVLEYSEGGEDWVELYTGSFNLSTNGANAELQMKYKIRANSYLGQMVLESIRKTAEAEKEFAIPLEKAVFRNFIANTMGHSIFEIPLETVDKLMKQFRSGDYEGAAKVLRDIAGESTTLTTGIDPAVPRAKISELVQKYKAGDHSGVSKLVEEIVRTLPGMDKKSGALKLDKYVQEYQPYDSNGATRLVREIAKGLDLNQAIMLDRVERLLKFLEWHKGKTSGNGISPQRLAAGAWSIASPDASPGRMIQMLRSSVWESSIPKDKVDALALEAMNVLELTPPAPREDPGEGNDPDALTGPVDPKNCKDPLTKPKWKPRKKN